VDINGCLLFEVDIFVVALFCVLVVLFLTGGGRSVGIVRSRTKAMEFR
jgi:hypothetical protein